MISSFFKRIGKKFIYVSWKFKYYYYTIFRANKSFYFNGKKYFYFYNQFRNTYRNERAIEIPIVLGFVRNNLGKQILELGNVLSHYYKYDHVTVDKYEKREGVINCDIVDFVSDDRFDLIISVSTLEHIGFDEEVKDQKKILKTIKKLKSLLKPNGQIIITVPIGYNPHLDTMLKENLIDFSEQHFLARTTLSNEWAESDKRIIYTKKYGSPYRAANGLVIGIINK